MRVEYLETFYECSDAYSFKDMTGWDLSARRDLNGQVIYASCFSQETPDREIFQMTGVTFIRCNLSNVLIPPNNTAIDCQRVRFESQPDGKDWEVDENNEPIRILR